MKTNQINSVNGLKVGQLFSHEGCNFIAKSFPTRYSVCGENPKPESGLPSSCKVAMSKVNYISYRTGEYAR